MITEEWKPIKGYEGLYAVSSLGRVKSIARKTYTGNRGVPERILKANNQHGYLCVILQRNGIVKGFKVHRLVAEHFICEKPFEDAQVNHIDGNKLNNSVNNLEWVTPLENTHHAMKHGLREGIHSQSRREKASQKMKERWKDPNYREFQSTMMKDVWRRRRAQND